MLVQNVDYRSVLGYGRAKVDKARLQLALS
jgi:hypothetical protein